MMVRSAVAIIMYNTIGNPIMYLQISDSISAYLSVSDGRTIELQSASTEAMAIENTYEPKHVA